MVGSGDQRGITPLELLLSSWECNLPLMPPGSPGAAPAASQRARLTCGRGGPPSALVLTPRRGLPSFTAGEGALSLCVFEVPCGRGQRHFTHSFLQETRSEEALKNGGGPNRAAAVLLRARYKAAWCRADPDGGMRP